MISWISENLFFRCPVTTPVTSSNQGWWVIPNGSAKGRFGEISAVLSSGRYWRVSRSHEGCADRELGDQGILCEIRNPMRDHWISVCPKESLRSLEPGWCHASFFNRRYIWNWCIESQVIQFMIYLGLYMHQFQKHFLLGIWVVWAVGLRVLNINT